MKDAYTSTAIALLFGLGVAVSGLPATAQQTQEAPAATQEAPAAEAPTADVTAEEYIPTEEAVTRAEERFEEFAVDEDGLTEEQLAEALPGLETEDITELFQEIDEDGDGVVSREEWRQWTDRAFAEVAGPEGLTAEQYGAWERTGRFDMDPMDEPGAIDEEPEEPAQQ